MITIGIVIAELIRKRRKENAAPEHERTAGSTIIETAHPVTKGAI